MKQSCRDIAEELVDYADGQLSTEQSNRVAEHLAECEDCRGLSEGLHKSLELTKVIWEDSLKETEGIHIARPGRAVRRRWPRYAAAVAAVILVALASIVWNAIDRPVKKEATFAEIEREITEAGNAARLLAAAELLAKSPNVKAIVKRQYTYIVKTYPDTPAAAKAKMRIKKL